MNKISNKSDSQEEIMSNYTFRPFDFSDEDYKITTDIWNTVWPDDQTTVVRRRHYDGVDKDKFWRRYVCEVNGRIVAYGVYGKMWWSEREGKYFHNFVTLPEYRNQGIGSAFHTFTLGKLSKRDDFKFLTADTREDMSQSIDFLQHRGFKQIMRYPRSKIDVQAFEPEKYAELVRKLEAKGIEFLTVPQVAERFEDYQYRYHRMETEIDKDVPSPDPFKETPFEDFKKYLFESPNFYPEANFIAVADDQFVGLSSLWKSTDTSKLSTGLTGVLRNHRRLGLATALKSKAIGFAKSQGIVEIDTDNEENNPMYQINMQLGFKPAPAHLDFQKEIEK